MTFSVHYRYALLRIIRFVKDWVNYYKSFFCKTAIPVIKNTMPVTINTAMFLILKT